MRLQHETQSLLSSERGRTRKECGEREPNNSAAWFPRPRRLKVRTFSFSQKCAWEGEPAPLHRKHLRSGDGGKEEDIENKS